MGIKDIYVSGFERDGHGRDRKPLNTPTNSNDLVEVRIKRLITSADPYDQESLISAVPLLVQAAKDPKSSKTNWLSRLYEQRGWIDSETATQLLRDIDVDSALSKLETICLQEARLRPEGSSIPRYRLPPAGAELGDYIRQTLEKNGIRLEGLKVRYLCNPERVEQQL